jgi:hypothetical protein
MSRVYRIRVRESVSRTINSKDRVSTQASTLQADELGPAGVALLFQPVGVDEPVGVVGFFEDGLQEADLVAHGGSRGVVVSIVGSGEIVPTRSPTCSPTWYDGTVADVSKRPLWKGNDMAELQDWQKDLYQQLRACPWCGNDGLQLGLTRFVPGSLRLSVRCSACKARWREIYDLRTITDVKATKLRLHRGEKDQR